MRRNKSCVKLGDILESLMNTNCIYMTFNKEIIYDDLSGNETSHVEKYSNMIVDSIKIRVIQYHHTSIDIKGRAQDNGYE